MNVQLRKRADGRVTETEVGDEESLYEVEVTLDDGRQVDVQLDEQFSVVGTEDDGTNDATDPGTATAAHPRRPPTPPGRPDGGPVLAETGAGPSRFGSPTGEVTVR